MGEFLSVYDLEPDVIYRSSHNDKFTYRLVANRDNAGSQPGTVLCVETRARFDLDGHQKIFVRCANANQEG